MWAHIKLHTARYLGVRALKGNHSPTEAELRECIQEGFYDVTEETRRNLVRVTYRAILSLLQRDN